MGEMFTGASLLDLLGLLGPVATLITGLTAVSVALMALHTAAAVNLRNKRIDVIMNCNARYDELSKEKSRIIKEISNSSSNKGQPIEISDHDKTRIEKEIELYNRRFWGLKSDQVDYWLAGYIDPETLISWFMSTKAAIHEPISVWSDFENSKLGGWASVKDFHSVTNARMYQIGEEISQPIFNQIGNSECYARLFSLFEAIEKQERSWISTLARNNRSRLTVSSLRDKLPGVVTAFLK